MKPGDRVLDVPSGDGFYSQLFAERLSSAGRVVAADCSDEMLDAVNHRERQPEMASIESVYANAYDLPFDDDTFDFVWCAQSLISLSAPDEKTPGVGTRRVLREIRRVVRPGGWVALMEQDALHHVLLPWPTELEMAIHRAHRTGFAVCCGHPQQLDPGRRLGGLLAETGFDGIRRQTIVADRYGHMEGELRLFLAGYFQELRTRIVDNIDAEALRQFDRLIDTSSEESFFNDPHFELTWLSFVTLGCKMETD